MNEETAPTLPAGKLPERRNGQITGNVGLYYCCYQLSRLGWNVMPTARNAKGVDIIAYNGDASRYIGVQVKALSKRSAVPLGGSLEKFMGDFWIIINNLFSAPTAYILLPSEVKTGAHLAGKDEKSAYWLEPKQYERAQFKEAWHRISDGQRLDGEGSELAHDWTTEDDIAVLALTKKYGPTGWQNDPLARMLISQRGIAQGSLGMAIRNFLSLLGLPGGLENSSKRQRESFRIYGNRSVDELRSIAEKEVGA